jgi:hypothetical protein
MAALSGEAVCGEKEVDFLAEISALAQAVGNGESEANLAKARDAIIKATGNEHALLDVAGVVGYFDSITKIVDFSGHYSDKIMKKVETLAMIVSEARKIRKTLCFCTRV